MSNGIANIIAALLISGAIVGTNYLPETGSAPGDAAADEQYAEWLTRAVGDIRNDIVVNCGCCGEGGGTGINDREAALKRTPTRSF